MQFDRLTLDEERVQSALEWLQELHAKRPLREYKEVKEGEKEKEKEENTDLVVRSSINYWISYQSYSFSSGIRRCRRPRPFWPME